METLDHSTEAMLTSTQKSLGSCSSTKTKGDLIRERFPIFRNFADTFASSKQFYFATQEKSLLTSDLPRMCDMGQIYSDAYIKQWIKAHLVELCKGSKEGEGRDEIIEELTEALFALFVYEKITAFVLFAAEMRVGKLGKIYGSLNVADVLECANNFLKSLKKRKQVLNEETRRERGDLNIKSPVFTLGEIGAAHSDGLAQYLKTAPKGSVLAYECIANGWAYELPKETAMFIAESKARTLAKFIKYAREHGEIRN